MTKFFVMLTVMAAAIFMLVTGAKAGVESLGEHQVIIRIDKSEQKMYVETPTDYYEWDVSTGRKGYHTPIGVYQPYLVKKIHYSRKYDNAPMPHSIFFHGGYAIHATTEVKKLGRPASHGCVRLNPQNARWLYHIVNEYGKYNTYIEIVE
jgi:lipoprotein-anchoring transpeptidase ErfK/SrfK